MSNTSAGPDLWATPLLAPATAASMAWTWRDAATALRRLAAEVPQMTHDLAAFHRPDVWQGAVATRFGDDLDRWRARLGTIDGPVGGLDLTAELLAVAARLDARAAALDGTTAPDPSWWGWRGAR